MQPKSLSNLTPDQLRASAEANREFQQAEAYKYYEAGMNSLHQANAVKDEMTAMMVAHVRNRKGLDQVLHRLGILILVYSLLQLLILTLLIDRAQMKGEFKQFLLIVIFVAGGSVISVLIDRIRRKGKD